MIGWVDVLVALSLPVAALALLRAKTLFGGVAIYVSFGLLVAYTWVRLHAPDVAMAEAAIGAGFTGALLLDAVGDLRRTPASPRAARWRTVAAAALALTTGALCVWAVAGAASAPASAGALARERVQALHVENPVTGVLLGFRAYDTLLEIAVLLLAVVAARSAAGVARRTDLAADVRGPLLAGMARTLAPVAVLTAAYLLWRGSSAPGGAFQAGALLAGAGVMLAVAEMRSPPSLARAPVRAAAAAGLVVFLLVGAAAMAAGEPLLVYPRGWAYQSILLIELFATASIAFGLLTLFGPGDPVGSR